MNYRRTLKVKVDDKGQLRVAVADRWRIAVEKECWFCGGMFATAKLPSNREAKFCSYKCRGRHSRKWKAQRYQITKICTICKKFYRLARNKAPRYFTCGNPACQFERRSINSTRRHQQPGQRQFHKVK